MANPGAGSLVITTTDAEFTNTSDMRLILTGKAPKLSIGPPKPGVGGLAISGLLPSRAYGLQLIGGSFAIAATVAIPKGSLSITERTPETIEEPPDRVAPESGLMALTGHVPTLGRGVDLGVASAALTGIAPVVAVGRMVDIPGPFELIDVNLVGKAPTASLSSEISRIGTIIENANATEDDSRYNICDRTGFRALPGALVKDGYGNLVLPEYRDSRHPQEFIKSRRETHKGPKRPEPVGDELDVDDLYPDGVTVDDL